MGIPSLGPLWLSASPVIEAALSAWDAAVLQGWKMRLQAVHWQDEVRPWGCVKSPADLCQHLEEAGRLFPSQRRAKN